MKCIPIFFCLFVFCSADPQILYLTQFTIANGQSTFAYEKGSNLYLSSSDSTDVLKNIILTIDGQIIPLDTLRDVTRDDGSQLPLKLGDSLTISTTNSNDITSKLTGFIYVSTAKQANDENFSVYVIQNNIKIMKTSGQSTSVILNTAYGVTQHSNTPFRTSLVKKIEQDHSAKLRIYSDIPYDNYTYDDTPWKSLFYNPIVFESLNENGIMEDTEMFFNNIEHIQMSYVSWYILSSGNINVIIEKLWMNNIETTTTSLNTTGLIVNAADASSINITVDFLNNPNPQTLGMFVKCQPTDNIDFIFSNNGQDVLHAHFNTTFPETGILEWKVGKDATKFQILSSQMLPGAYSVQYFVIDGVIGSLTTQPTL
ncbi:unnamed protein product [Caenorhabditis angaria]|uniref:CUB-like domain-containing protein n=1 Tax=Caenorhabditis angaria TaxID=860376 RepID=A0A9P1ILK7_9PELO|nr:unnamed protein product [Caenorhabditis angaria]